MDRHRILILGGTTEARQLAERLASRTDFDTLLSLAGRTATPIPLAVPVRTGGFGGAEGLANFLHSEKISLVIDATHPFAGRISVNAHLAARNTDIPILALRRAAWEQRAGDRWTRVASISEAVSALGIEPRRVFLAIGKQEAHHFSAAAQHHYLVRSIESVEPPLDVPHASYILARGPFSEEGETRLLQEHRIEIVVSKNSGGEATYGKIAAARNLGIEVIMIDRQGPPDIPAASDVDTMLRMIDHRLSPAKNLGV